ncbi:hypothetical protein ACLOJK_029972 [Asimina triloba]
MRRYSPPYYSPPRRGYGGRRSPPRRGYGGYGGRKEPNNGSLLVRNIPLNCRPEDLRVPFERFGPVRDVYIPKDYYTGEPRGFAFVQFVDPHDASEAQYHMNRQLFGGREITVVLAAETRKRPEEMRARARVRGPGVIVDAKRGDLVLGLVQYLVHALLATSQVLEFEIDQDPFLLSQDADLTTLYPLPGDKEGVLDHQGIMHMDDLRSMFVDDHTLQVMRMQTVQKLTMAMQSKRKTKSKRNPAYDAEGTRAHWKSPGHGSRSPSGSRSRSADLSPRHSR